MTVLRFPLRKVERILREPGKPGATLMLDCGHVQYLDDFPPGQPPPCFRRECREPSCKRPQ